MALVMYNYLKIQAIILILCIDWVRSDIKQDNFQKTAPQAGLSCSSDAKTMVNAPSTGRCGMLCKSYPECISFSVQVNSSINIVICQLFTTSLSKCQASIESTFAFYKIMKPATSGTSTATVTVLTTASTSSTTPPVPDYPFNENPPATETENPPATETENPPSDATATSSNADETTLTSTTTEGTNIPSTTVETTTPSTMTPSTTIEVTTTLSTTTEGTTTFSTTAEGTTMLSTTTAETSTLNPNWNYTYAQTGVQGSIDSPGIDQNQNYGNNWDLYWKIIAPTGNTITLNPYQLNIQGTGTNCNNDYLQFLEGENNNVNLGTYCGQQGGTQSQTSSNEVLLHFHSDNDGITGLGFKVMYYASAPSQNNGFPTMQTFNIPTQQNNFPTAPNFTNPLVG